MKLSKTQDALPFLDLFGVIQRSLQPLGVPLDMAHYEDLRRALALGFGVASWEDGEIRSWENLRRLCQRLWVKPVPSYDQALKVFDRAFDGYMAMYQAKYAPPVEDASEGEVAEIVTELEWPEIPLRQGTTPQPDQRGKTQIAGAIAGRTTPQFSPRTAEGFRLTPQDFPLTLPKVQSNWRSLRRSLREGARQELDLEATVTRVVQQGFLDEVVMRPIVQQRAELIVLVDDNEPMVPFQGAIAPLIMAIEEGWIGPATIYRFTSFPHEYLFGWRRRSEATAVATVLARAHRTRTVMLIVSDAGAALGAVNGLQIVGVEDFVSRSLACVRQLIWLNPLPRHRWQGCSAEAIAQLLEGRMVALDHFEPNVLRSQELGGLLR